MYVELLINRLEESDSFFYETAKKFLFVTYLGWLSNAADLQSCLEDALKTRVAVRLT